MRAPRSTARAYRRGLLPPIAVVFSSDTYTNPLYSVSLRFGGGSLESLDNVRHVDRLRRRPRGDRGRLWGRGEQRHRLERGGVGHGRGRPELELELGHDRHRGHDHDHELGRGEGEGGHRRHGRGHAGGPLRASRHAARERGRRVHEPQLHDGVHHGAADPEPVQDHVAQLPDAGRPDRSQRELAMTKRTMRGLLAAAALAVGGVASTDVAAQGVPQTITHQGRLYDASGKPITTTLAVQFAIYVDTMTTTSLWTETDMITFDDGYFSVSLGAG